MPKDDMRDTRKLIDVVAAGVVRLEKAVGDLGVEMRSGFEKLDRRLGNVETRVENIETRVEVIETRVEVIETDVRAIRHDTHRRLTELESR